MDIQINHKLDTWSEHHHKAWMDMLRIVLGICLIIKGYEFIVHTSYLLQILRIYFGIAGKGVAFLIAFSNLLTGFLLVIGLATRASCLLQIPILFGAVFFVNAKGGSTTAELIFSALILFLLCFFLVKGSGKFSVYYYALNSRGSRQTDESDEEYKPAPLDGPMDKDGNLL